MANRIEELAEEISSYNGLPAESLVTIAKGVSDLPGEEESEEIAEAFLQGVLENVKRDG